MRKLLVGLTAAVAVAAGPLAAPAAYAQSAADVRAQRQAEAFLSEAVTWTSRYQQLLERQLDLLDALNTGGVKALDHFEAQRTQEGAAWARTWGAEQRAALAALKASQAELARAPTPRLVVDGVDLTRDRALSSYHTLIATLPRQAERHIASLEDLSHRMIAAVQRVAGGDQGALHELGLLSLELDIEVLTSEIEVMEATRASAGTSPQIHVIDGSVALNRALIVKLRLDRSNYLSQALDRRQAADAIRAEAAHVATAAEAIPPAVAKVRIPSGLTPDLRRKFEEAMASFGDNRAAMEEISAGLNRLADAIAAGEAYDSDAVAEAAAAVIPAFERHLAADQRRRALFSAP